MTLPPVIRIFFALDLPADTKESLGRYIGTLKKKSKSHAIRWTKPENLHITLHFLPEVQSEHVTKLVTNVRAQVESMFDHMMLGLSHVQLFPNPYRPRVIVLEVTPQDQLSMLASEIGKGIQSTNYEIETRPFRAHLTLGRIKQPQGANLNFINEVAIPDFKHISVNEVVLFRSEPQPEGSKYTPIERIIFSKSLVGT